MKIIEIDGKPVGYEEGDTCNRLVSDDTNIAFQCEGTMEYTKSENCSCHLSAPCGSCMDVHLKCSDCGECVEN